MTPISWESAPRPSSGSAKGRSFFNAGNALACLRRQRRIDLGSDYLGPLPARFRQNLAPGRDDDGMAEGLAAVGMAAGLRGGDDEGAVLDRPRALQHVPVRLAGLARERGGCSQRDGAGMRLRAIEMREADVVADGHAEPQPRQVGDHCPVAGMIDRRFPPALAARKIDVEEMDLVVARKDASTAPEDEGAVGDATVGGLQRERADMENDAELAGERGEALDGRIARLPG